MSLLITKVFVGQRQSMVGINCDKAITVVIAGTEDLLPFRLR